MPEIVQKWFLSMPFYLLFLVSVILAFMINRIEKNPGTNKCATAMVALLSVSVANVVYIFFGGM